MVSYDSSRVCDKNLPTLAANLVFRAEETNITTQGRRFGPESKPKPWKPIFISIGTQEFSKTEEVGHGLKVHKNDIPKTTPKNKQKFRRVGRKPT